MSKASTIENNSNIQIKNIVNNYFRKYHILYFSFKEVTEMHKLDKDKTIEDYISSYILDKILSSIINIIKMYDNNYNKDCKSIINNIVSTFKNYTLFKAISVFNKIIINFDNAYNQLNINIDNCIDNNNIFNNKKLIDKANNSKFESECFNNVTTTAEIYNDSNSIIKVLAIIEDIDLNTYKYASTLINSLECNVILSNKKTVYMLNNKFNCYVVPEYKLNKLLGFSINNVEDILAILLPSVSSLFINSIIEHFNNMYFCKKNLNYNPKAILCAAKKIIENIISNHIDNMDYLLNYEITFFDYRKIMNKIARNNLLVDIINNQVKSYNLNTLNTDNKSNLKDYSSSNILKELYNLPRKLIGSFTNEYNISNNVNNSNFFKEYLHSNEKDVVTNNLLLLSKNSNCLTNLNNKIESNNIKYNSILKTSLKSDKLKHQSKKKFNTKSLIDDLYELGFIYIDNYNRIFILNGIINDYYNKFCKSIEENTKSNKLNYSNLNNILLNLINNKIDYNTFSLQFEKLLISYINDISIWNEVSNLNEITFQKELFFFFTFFLDTKLFTFIREMPLDIKEYIKSKKPNPYSNDYPIYPDFLISSIEHKAHIVIELKYHKENKAKPFINNYSKEVNKNINCNLNNSFTSKNFCKLKRRSYIYYNKSKVYDRNELMLVSKTSEAKAQCQKYAEFIKKKDPDFNIFKIIIVRNKGSILVQAF